MGDKTKQRKDSGGQDKSRRGAMGMEARQKRGRRQNKAGERKKKERRREKKKNPAMGSLIGLFVACAPRHSSCPSDRLSRAPPSKFFRRAPASNRLSRASLNLFCS